MTEVTKTTARRWVLNFVTVTFAIGGALAVAGSLLIPQLKPVAPGLMLGGIASFFMAGIHVWNLAPGVGRLITIVVVFVILVGVGLYAFRDLPGR